MDKTIQKEQMSNQELQAQINDKIKLIDSLEEQMKNFE